MPQTARNLSPLHRRDIIEIDESRCDGCGLCVRGCAEGALAIVDGKARLVSETYCDGLGACLAECPRGALTIVSRESEAFDEAAALAALAAREDGGSGSSGGSRSGHGGHEGGCPGAVPRALAPRASASETPSPEEAGGGPGLANWPIQMNLVPPKAPFLEAGTLTVAADCTAFACPGFHARFLAGGVPLVIGCPKLDDVDAYIIKISEILKAHPSIRELTVPIMEVPCCRGLAYAAVRGLERSGRDDVSLTVQVVGLDGSTEEEAPREASGEAM
ncbi:MAG: 4Fe-4S dicluster domain-containing protein [Deltaproteobacteria bacterium]|jgi:Pyruvate/2-oxoacid:ferredoxin oxidoreductase delta subunit|nr:4Fe-4S dicluster domain-containing protein [Deltaproteobacteria bacterium]